MQKILILILLIFIRNFVIAESKVYSSRFSTEEIVFVEFTKKENKFKKSSLNLPIILGNKNRKFEFQRSQTNI